MFLWAFKLERVIFHICIPTPSSPLPPLSRFANERQIFQILPSGIILQSPQNIYFLCSFFHNELYSMKKTKLHWPAWVDRGSFSVHPQSCAGLTPSSFWLCGSWRASVLQCANATLAWKEVQLHLDSTAPMLSYLSQTRNTIFLQELHSTICCQVSRIFVELGITVTTDSSWSQLNVYSL